ncbi:hypothetical protein IE53DRAFT_374761 [Violaceomyces palustris]|uniref:Uncharacterized protein n=1 Tax=Violaceomyces palustris TaxID=1673888 RepID=A0ACD0NWF7_9BASI|nr:hypothetical protein IE53DRAFT_374761 [Violaceomyces palustris]
MFQTWTASVRSTMGSLQVCQPLLRGAIFRSFCASPIPYAANPQSGKPASDDWEHAKRNMGEEAKQIRATLESSIAGSQHHSALVEDAKSITAEVAKSVPRPALVWGAAGVIPYLCTSAASIWLARQQHMVSQGVVTSIDSETASALLVHAQNVQVGWGAVILSFLGAIHWGFEFSKYGGELGNQRYVVGIIPAALAWPTLLLAPQMALISQWAAFVLIWFIDLRATTRGWVPKWYSTYRFWLTAAVGTSILATLAGINHYSDTSGLPTSKGGMTVATKLSHEVEKDAKLKMELLKKSAQGIKGGKMVKAEVEGDVEAVSTGEQGQGYVQVSNVKRKQTEEKEEEEEEEERKKGKDESDEK